MKTRILLFATFMSILSFANAQWQQTSCPSDKAIICLAVSGTNIFAGTNGNGVYLSNDNGTTWTQVNNGLTNTDVRTLAVKGTDIYAGTYGSGIFLSTNNGISWNAISTGLPINNVVLLSVIGGNIFAGTDNNGALLFLSTDNGSSWSSVSTSGNFFTSLATNGSDIFAGTFGGTVNLSTNNGLNWANVSVGITATIVRAITVCGTNIIAGSDYGIFLSSNNGTNWNAVDSTASYIDAVEFAVSETNIFAGTDEGKVFLSSNLGASWSDVSLGIISSYVRSLTIAGTNIFAGTFDNGIWKRQISDFASSGIDEIKKNSHFIIYPNPAIDKITIEATANDKDTKIVVCNIQGQTILEQSLQLDKTDIDISGFAKGVYILKLCSNDKIAVTRFMKE